MRKQPLTPRKQGQQERSRKTVDAIIESTIQLLYQDGLESTSTNHIAEKAGVSVGSLYQYFPNKESILKKVAEIESHKRRKEVEALLEKVRTKNLDKASDDLIEYLVEAFYKRKRLHTFLLKQIYSSQLHEVITAHEDAVQSMFEDFIKHYFPKLSEEQRKRFSFMLVHSCLGILRSATFFDYRKMKREEVSKMLKHLVSKTLSFD